MLYVLAEKLGRRIPEMMEMTVEEFAGWIAYFRTCENIRKKSSK
jgi:hypothetical protein